MRFTKLLSLFLLLCTTINCSQKTLEPIQPLIIPEPLSEEITDGAFILSSHTELEYKTEFKIAVDFLKSYIKPINLSGEKASNKIIFIKDKSVLNAEGYILEITPERIEIRANSDKGAFYAVQTIRQLLPVDLEAKNNSEKEFVIQCLKIEDKPKFQYRGMHLDVARHFYSTDFIKKYIDAIAMLKMNTFHWHLTDDQGWRIEIKKYPLLNEISAYRNETLVGHYSDQPHQFDGKKYGGFYTQKQIKEIVAYAHARHVTVIPEIEMPGHAQAAIAAYPELGCTGKNVEVATKWGVFDNIYCTNDKIFAFLEDVLDEVIPLFPSSYIHIGGDEAPKTNWKTCSRCQRKIKSEGLKDEHELQNYFITRIEKYLNAKGKQIIGWDEILEGGLAPNATVMSWRGTNGAVQAAKEKHNVIMTPTSHCYFDYYQSDNSDEPLAIGGYLPLEKVYNFNPIPKGLTDEESQYVLGAQGNIWTEYMPTSKQVEYMLFPRALAMSEVGWSDDKNKNYDDFITRVEHFNKRLDVLDFNYANHLYEVEGELISENNNQFFKLKTLTKNKTIRYTLDGTQPDINSKNYVEKIPITENATIKAAVFNERKQLGKDFVQIINKHKAVGKKITINREPHKAYSGSGAAGLVNGISGNDKRYGDKEWLGFWGDDLEITIDLGEEVEINSIKTRFYNGNGQWIYAPNNINIEFVLDDGSLAIDKIELQPVDKKIVDLNYEFKTPKNLNVKVKSITIKIPSYGTIPEGLQGAGQKAWTFIDEIIVN